MSKSTSEQNTSKTPIYSLQPLLALFLQPSSLGHILQPKCRDTEMRLPTTSTDIHLHSSYSQHIPLQPSAATHPDVALDILAPRMPRGGQLAQTIHSFQPGLQS